MSLNIKHFTALFILLLILSTASITIIFKVESDTSSSQFIKAERDKLRQESVIMSKCGANQDRNFETTASFYPEASVYLINSAGTEIKRGNSSAPLISFINPKQIAFALHHGTHVLNISKYTIISEPSLNDNSICVLVYDKKILKQRNGQRFIFYYLLLVMSSLVISVIYARLKEKQVEIREREQSYLADLHEKNMALEEKNVAYSEAINSKNRFFSIVAHDLRNPFQVVLGYTGLLLENYENMSASEIKEYFQDIETATGQLMRLLDNLLLWSRSQTESIRIRPAHLDLQALVASSISLVQVNASTKKIELISHIPPHCFVEADRDMVMTILRNLMTNAVKYTPAEGKVTVSAIPHGDNLLQITVKDSGIGMTRENMDKLFRTDTTFSHKGTNGEEGTGLGLVLCTEFVEKHGGKIWVESDIGEGSEFHFTLPHHPDSAGMQKGE